MGRGRKLTEEVPNTDTPEKIIVGLFIELLIPGCAEDFQKKRYVITLDLCLRCQESLELISKVKSFKRILCPLRILRQI